MEINEKMFGLGSKRSIIREIFEYSKKRSLEIGKDNVFDFSLGNPSVEPPKEVNEAIKQLCDKESAILLHGYTSAQGDLNTRKVIANNIKNRFNVDINENLIYMTCGAAASLTISLKAILNEGDEVIVFAPFFTEYRVFVENANGKLVVSNPNLNNFQIDFEDFESKITDKTRAVIINSPNNPSGVVYNEDTIVKLTDLLKKYEKKHGKTIYLISDEPYRELVYNGVFVPYLMNYYDDTIVCYSYSKALSLPGDRIGYIAVSPKMKNKNEVYLAVCGAGRSLGFVCAPSLFQHVITKCDGKTSDISKYKENRDLLYDNLTNFGYKCVKPDGAFYLFVKSLEDDAYKFFERAKEHEILVVPCDDFGVKGYVRIAYCVDRKRIENSLPHFEKLIKEYNK
ncbi:MAG: pyridoxal phosphate-dependent aminotransferase [Firmicutes bacterium]|nr:pyridoxal phosphate-dependent aminotransferase [Candidatus Caballimonas caccae]